MKQPLAWSFLGIVALDILLIAAIYFHGGNMHLLKTLHNAFLT